MGRNFFQVLPSEMTTDILSRLPFRSFAISKCVCKSWLNLLNSDYNKKKIPARPSYLEDEPISLHDLRNRRQRRSGFEEPHVPLTYFETPSRSTPMECTAANGLLLLHPHDYTDNHVYICNPLTREYIELVCPINYASFEYPLTFDFCMSKISGQYKVVYIVRDNESDYFQVYTLGTGKWRRVEASVPDLKFYSYGHAECNGNLHWVGDDGNLHWVGDDSVQPSFQICAFDVETECFSFFSPPPPALPGDEELTVFKDCLCICYSQDYEIIIWLMKEYGVEESWTIEYKLSYTDFLINGFWVYPIKVFKDGDILMLLHRRRRLMYYSNKTRTIQLVAGFHFTYAIIFTPSLFSLKRFEFENVISF